MKEKNMEMYINKLKPIKVSRVKMRQDALTENTDTDFRKATVTMPVRRGVAVTWSLTLCWLTIIFALLAAVTVCSAVVFEEAKLPKYEKRSYFYQHKCFSDDGSLTMPNKQHQQHPIGLQVSNRPLHQIMSRIFAIVLREKLNYRNISLIPLRYGGNIMSENYERDIYNDIFDLLKSYPEFPDMPMINLAVWMPSTAHSIIPRIVTEAGASITAGRFGWFVPETQVPDSQEAIYSLHYGVFLNQTHPDYAKYILSDEILAELRGNKPREEFISPNCIDKTCVTLIAAHRHDTAFVMHHIAESGSYLNVLWLGDDFREELLRLYDTYAHNSMYYGKRFIVVHWTPSDFIDAEIKFKQITLPHCEELYSLQDTLCKYELMPVLKYYDQRLAGEHRLVDALRKFYISDENLSDLQFLLNEQRNLTGQYAAEELYNAVACKWLQQNTPTTNSWISTKSQITIQIGGIFPLRDNSRGHQNLDLAVQQAVDAINDNDNILRNYKLEVVVHDGQCKPDEVMKLYIHYFNEPKVLGVLGPACSETVEPIAGISKHTNMAIISYSAEGASFADRKTYPYFFRTIGSNRQYEDVYIRLMKHLSWRRVAALTEDGQKYTEYISHMEAAMKQHNLELIINKKFLSDVTAVEMNKHLTDMKQKHAKIIIADIHSRNAELALCEAYKLGMTAYQGYVWFLPSWLSKNWNTSGSNHSCTSEQLQLATEGHFSIMHAPFGQLDSIMQENISVGEWLQTYAARNITISNYTGFAYDATWAYALAADKLLAENAEMAEHFRSRSVVERLTELIWQTDFNGLSGRVRFGQGGSRITDLNIVQWRKLGFHQVGKFSPSIVGAGNNMHTNSGKLMLYENEIVWLSGGQAPTDGTYDCRFSALAEFMNTDCDSAAFTFTAIICGLAFIAVTLISFLFWKQRYDKKLKRSAKIMKNFGIDLLSPSRNKCNTLDKWEIPKEKVVLNRRLGEGAFGTVYGGEAQIGVSGWTAVAVKTLKAGASTEDRLDFLSEAEAMKRFDHKNIVKLLGVCLQSEPNYTIMEFMLYGDLKTYLLARRHMVNEKVTDESDISPKRLTMYAMDVARGLAYLAEQKYVHRDVACRNCLVNAQRVVKLGDFGMARATYESDYYRFNRKGMLPVRWMAPESLALGMFTPASDVWAMGVVLYEIITFGSFPYQGLTNNQALEYIKSGKTLQIPTGVKPHLEGLIKACWSQEAKKRPTAAEVVDYISNYPRLLTPCLDFPGASVQLPETESDELELLPKVRKSSPTKKDSTLDILPQTPVLNHFERNNDLIENIELPEHTNIEMCAENMNLNIHPNNNNIDAISLITPEGYSIMSPLLMHQMSENSDSSQARLLKKASNEALQQTQI